MSDKPLRRPSDEPVELQKQLLRELDGIRREGDSWGEPTLFRAYLQHAQALVWQRVASGDLNAPREILDHLLPAQPFVDSHLPEPPGLAARAAQEVHQTIRSLYLADRVLQEARTRVRLADRDRSRTERQILRVLFENRGTYMRRGAVRARMDSAGRPTPARVGQILVDLHREGLVIRIHGRAQGSPSAAFYALSPQGFELCRGFGFEEATRVRRIVEKVVAPDLGFKQRKVLIDTVATCSDPAVSERVIDTLEKDLHEERDEASSLRYKEALVAVLLARRQIDTASSAAPGAAAATERGLYILESPRGAKSGLQSAVDAYVQSLERNLAKDRQIQDPDRDELLNMLLRERNRRISDRVPALAHA